GLFHELGVEIEAHRGDVPALVGTEEIARAADLQIVRGDLEARAQLGELLQDLKALLRLAGDRAPRRYEHISICTFPAAPDAAADLVELRKTKRIGTVHEDGVGAGDVEAALDDGGAEQDVDLAIDELGHH